MKRFLVFLLLLSELSFGQIKITEMPTYIGDPAGAWVPIVISGTNRKIDASYIGKDSFDVKEGLVYDTLYWYKNGVKKFFKLTRAGTGDENAWKRTGNAIATAPNFIGTTDNRSLRFRVNNVEAMKLDSPGARLYLYGGNNPLLSLKQGVSDREWQLRVGVGTGFLDETFNIFNALSNKKHFTISTTGQVGIGNFAHNIPLESALYVWGTGFGANIDAQPDSTINDEANIEVESAGYQVNGGKGVAIQYNGGQGTGSTFGYPNRHLGQLRFHGDYNIIKVTNNRSLRFGIFDIERMVLDSNGRLGIGIQSPLHPLSVAGNFQAVNGSESVTIIPGTDAFISQAGNNNLTLSTNGQSRLKILGNGRIGIGGIQPLELLDVNGNIQARDAFILNAPPGNLRAEYANLGDNEASIRTISNHPLSFRTGDIERYRVTANGTIAINTTSTSADVLSRGLYSNRSIGVNPDSIPHISAIGSNELAVIDLTTGQFKKILPTDLGISAGGITSINSHTGPALTLQVGTAGNNFAVDNTVGNTVTINAPDGDLANARGWLTNSGQVIGGLKVFRGDNDLTHRPNANSTTLRGLRFQEANGTNSAGLLVNTIGSPRELRLINDNALGITTFMIGSTEKMRLTSNGLGIGTNNPSTISSLHVEDGGLGIMSVGGPGGGTAGRYIAAGKALPTSNGQRYGTLTFISRAGAEDYREGASIEAVAAGAWTSGSSHPSNLTFNTTSSGATTASERLRITQTGIGVLHTNPAGLIHAEGNLPVIITNTTALGSTSGANLELYAKANPTTGDQLMGQVLWGSRSGAENNNRGAGIAGWSEGAWTSGSSHPTYLAFYTATSGSTARLERMRIAANGNVGIGTGAALTTNPLQVHLTDAATNTVSFPVRYAHFTSGGPAGGLGVGEQFVIQNSTGSHKVVGTIEFVYTDPVNGTEDADLSLKLSRNGTLTEVFKVNSLGNIVVGTYSVTTANSVTGDGTGGNPVKLTNDVTTPGNSAYYGTGATGSRGWQRSILYEVQNAALTTNTTQTTAHTITIDDNSAGKVTITFVGYDNSNNQYLVMKRSVAYKKTSGTLTIGTIRTIETDEVDGLTSSSVTLDSNSGNIRARVTGEGTKNIYWGVTVKWEKNIPAL